MQGIASRLAPLAITLCRELPRHCEERSDEAISDMRTVQLLYLFHV